MTSFGVVALVAGFSACAIFTVVTIRRDRTRTLLAIAEVLKGDTGGGVGSPVSGDLATALGHLDRMVHAERQRSAEIERSYGRLAGALSGVPQGLVVCDAAGSVVYRSDAALAFVRARHGDALAEQAIAELLGAALRDDPAERAIDLYGPPRRSLIIRAFRLGPADRPSGAAAIIEDVSERRRLEAVRRDFVANVSHELKSPIGALGILAETMQGEPDREVAQRLAGRMQLEAFRVSRIIDDLLDLSRIEGDEAPVREPVAVALVLEQAAERIQPVADHRSIRIDVVPPSDPISILGDRRQLVSALHNLLENAIKYSDDTSTVEVWAVSNPRGKQALVDISVRDFGIGIPTQDHERIFERFYRVDRARARDTGGTGLGLAIVRHVATNHGGSVSVVSQEGKGSTFTLTIPAAGKPPQANAEPECTDSTSSTAMTPGSPAI
ncbi:MAG: hypothetical protein NVS3B21_05820 [Acidimicrobiales bacterium]